MNTVKINNRTTEIIAHRGLSGIETENTCASFIAAANRSYYGLETDVRVTADGQLILSHDNNTLRTSGEEYFIEATDFDVLRSIKLIDRVTEQKRGDLVLATPEEFLRICKKYEKHAVIEIKDLFTREQIIKLVELVKQVDWFENTTFIAFTIENLIMLKEMYPEAEAQFLTRSTDDLEGLIALLKKYDLGLDAKRTALNREIIMALKKADIVVNSWTIDDKDLAEEFVSAGIDYITTNILEGE